MKTLTLRVADESARKLRQAVIVRRLAGQDGDIIAALAALIVRALDDDEPELIIAPKKKN